ncbi:MAG: hypothetical protein GXY36_03175 [Chloroflexi bacterium]|nr:hypothetical protein [Chloroflexota bacterium]
MGVQVPLRRTNRFRANAFRGGRGLEQLQQRWWRLTRAQRPILGFLVTHRRRFTTGHKHKQPYRG